jgi:DNA-binding SARP family transcriptional activator
MRNVTGCKAELSEQPFLLVEEGSKPMSRLTIRMLGPPRFQRDDESITLARRKGVALLAYLATVDGPQMRDYLATLLWPGYGQSDARGNLQGFSLEDSADFDAWQLRTANYLQSLFIDGSDRLITQLLARNEYEAAIATAQRTLAMLPSREATHRLFMASYAQAGDRVSALQQFERCRSILRMEQGLAPDALTRSLHDQIRSDTLNLDPSVHKLSMHMRRPEQQVPPLPANFVARDSDLQAILSRLQNPTCHLLSLLGPGGMGKTYLAYRVTAERSKNQTIFPDGMLWINMAGISTPEDVPLVVANRVGLRFRRDRPPARNLTPEACRLEAVRWLTMIRAKSTSYRWERVHDWVDRFLTELADQLTVAAFPATEAEGAQLDAAAVIAYFNDRIA